MAKTYLGDGVYADVEDYAIVLTTETGVETTNTIILEPPIYNNLVACIERLRTREPPDDERGVGQ